jgi:hypothetical protein
MAGPHRTKAKISVAFAATAAATATAAAPASAVPVIPSVRNGPIAMTGAAILC